MIIYTTKHPLDRYILIGTILRNDGRISIFFLGMCGYIDIRDIKYRTFYGVAYKRT